MLFYEEIFSSIQGEGLDSGLPCVFVRLFGCPIGCVYCDQKQSNIKMKRISIQNILNQIIKYKKIKNVCITGGEPLIYEEVIPLAQELLTMGKKVSIETSGCVPIPDMGYKRSFKFVMDIKCPCSEVTDKNIYDNLYKLQSNDEVKFVVKDRNDYDFMCGVLNKYPTYASILISPLFDNSNKPVIGKELVEWVLEDKLNVRVQLQIHKILNVQ